MKTEMLLKISKFFLYLTPLSIVIVYQGTLFPFIVGKYVFFRTVVDLALIFFMFAWMRGETLINTDKKLINTERKKIWQQPLVIAVLLFSFVYVLVGFFGVNPQASFWSNFERGEGSLQIIHLCVFFVLLGLVFRDDKSWIKMLIVSVWSGILMILYGVMAALGVSGFIGVDLCQRFSGSLGNSAYAGTFFIYMIFYAAYLANESKEKLIKYLWGGLIIIFIIFLLLTQTRGALLGLGISIIAGLLYVFFNLPKGKIKNLILLMTILLITCGGLAINFRQYIDLMPFCAGGGNRILNVDLKTENFQTRLLLWKESINAFKERPILGWGPENFTTAFEKYYNPYFTTWYDRAHNIFFDYLVMTGLLGLLSFISIFGVYYWQFFRTRINTDKLQQIYTDKNQNKISINQQFKNPYQSVVQQALLFALPIAYLVQGLVLFDVLPIYINLFLFLAFANWRFSLKH